MSDSVLTWACIDVTGEDAGSFLEGQLSQSTDSLGGGKWTCVLDPSSVVISSAWLRGSEDHYELLVPQQCSDVVLGRLQRFKLRVRVTLSVSEARDAPLNSLADLAQTGWPWVAEYERNLTPHSFGSHFVSETISFSKGCYTGQELVGRMDARGASMPWRFADVTGPSLEQIESCIESFGPDGPKGVTTVLTTEPVRAFAIVHRSALSENVSDPTVVIRAVN